MTDTDKVLLRGLLPPDPELHAKLPSASSVGFTWPAVSYPIDKRGGVVDLGMGGNGPDPTLTVNGGQPCGDCGPNAVPKNVNTTTAALLGEAFTPLTSDQVVALYFTYQAELAGIAWRPEGDNWTAPDGLDNGVEPGAWLLWLYQKGYIDGFVTVDLSDLEAALQTFNAIPVAVNLNPNADDQVNNGQPWDVGPGDEPDPDDGHFITFGAVNAAAGPFYWGTWGQWQPSTRAWRDGCPTNVYAVITATEAEAASFPLAAVTAELDALGGQAQPVPTPPAPAPPPQPGPEPTPPVPDPGPTPPGPVIPPPRPPLPLSHNSWWEEVLRILEDLGIPVGPDFNEFDRRREEELS